MRHVHENIQLDQSLRQSRSIWLALAIVFLPGAGIGIIRMLFDLAIIFGSGDYADMSAKIRPLPAPFLASHFGPYH